MTNVNDVKPKMAIRTHTRLGKTDGFIVKPEYITARKPNSLGTVYGFIPGHGGDVWWVEHKDGAIAAYCFDEFDAEPEAEGVNK